MLSKNSRNGVRSLLVGSSLLTALLIGAQARAEETIVKNDSVVDFGQAVIVGDFIQGEMAGARLTSPCDGTIVAVQILWLEGVAGHGQSLEEAIHIYDDDGAGFPVPGTQLALLEGPVMTPGYMNEFRYLDEAQTIPINVPVTAGQNFYVAFEFYNPTSVNLPPFGDGTPSVVRDTSGCQAQRNILYAIPGGWIDFCDYLLGDIVIRAVIDCPGATGACCHATGICENEVEEEDCQGFGDQWHEDLACGEITCTARGACCRMGGCLQLVQQATCELVEGVYAGHGTDCGDDVCVAGACCIEETGECILNFGFQCAGLGGDYLGPGTSCDPNPCPQPTGACCIGLICFSDQTEEECTGAAGDWAGPWTTCDDNSGSGYADACECLGIPVGDFEIDGLVDGLDIQGFVTEFINQVPGSGGYCRADIDRDGVLDGDDITDFVMCLLTGTCPPE
ncbi:MAG: hypothetical protein JXQ75_17565 [Phycisphaerae bacterium]|nr:hypothetical protein [Phycisphaerae bacterium]